MRVLHLALHVTSAIAVLSSSVDFMKHQIEQGHWREVSNENSVGVVDYVVNKTHILTNRMSDMLNTQQLRHPAKIKTIREASTTQFVVDVEYRSLGCKSFYEATVEASDVCFYSVLNGYSTYMTTNATFYKNKYYRDKFCESPSYRNETTSFVNKCATTSLKGMFTRSFTSSTPLVPFDRPYVALR